jgi:hypothetical protein
MISGNRKYDPHYLLLPVLEKCLRKQGQKPMGYKENKNRHTILHIIVIVFKATLLLKSCLNNQLRQPCLRFSACYTKYNCLSLQKRIQVILFPVYFQRLLRRVRPMRRFRHLLFRQMNEPLLEV